MAEWTPWKETTPLRRRRRRHSSTLLGRRIGMYFTEESLPKSNHVLEQCLLMFMKKLQW